MTNPFDDIGPDVFQDRDRLREDYIPKEIVERDEEIDELIHGLAPVVNGYSPDHMFTAGPHGSGKTVCASFVLDQLEDQISHNNQLREVKETVHDRLQEECQGGAFADQYDSADELLAAYSIQSDSETESRRLLEDYESTVGEPLSAAVPVDVLPPGTTDAEDTIIEALGKSLPDKHIDLTVKWVNCAGVSTGYQLAIRIANAFRSSEDKEKIKNTGHAEQRVYDEMFKEIERTASTNQEDRQKTVLLVLDEIGIVRKLDTLFYKLTRARGKGGDLENAKLGTICLSNNTTFRDQFTTRTESSLTAKHIDFDAYDANELQSVLRARADKAFRGEALEEDVIPLCAAMATKRGGDARFALQLLLKAGDIANRANSSMVCKEHVEEAEEKLEQENVESIVGRYQSGPQVELVALVNLRDQSDEPVTTRELFDHYEELAGREKHDSVGFRQFMNHLKMFEEDGIIVKEGTRANAPEIVVPEYPTDHIRGALQDDIIQRYLGENADTGPQVGSGSAMQVD
ncbi:hypothetical protein [Halobacterium rubrum]|uniref:hypothetical protein n=1 Tax=Halobacterium TaxID=2239 RepID=UPI001F1DE8AA|nr:MULTISPECIES: hypothetical protein [Halobacterium]MDH5021756.1 hypothetical protein [Halobacterium rubrum]